MITPASETVVYAGPSIAAARVQLLLPGCTTLGPIRRGELYRDRMLGYSSFVIIDGVFFEDRAVSPREVLDVLADGAWVAGAASLGALRAAECWPAGMVGVGSIFRLFRRGSLQSDDEVAVAFDPGNGFSTVALVNVRFALRRALRAHSLTPEAAARILAAARAIHYSERTWPRLLAEAGCDPRLLRFVEGHDLKRLDAERVLRRVACLQRRAADAFLRPRTPGRHFVPSEMHRESTPDPLQGRPEPQARQALLEWLRVSGRIRRYLEPPSAPRDLAALKDGEVAGSWTERAWATLTALGERDTELYRHHALMAAAAWARDRGLHADEAARQAAERDIATEHGVASFHELRGTLAPFPEFLAKAEAYRELLGVAKQVRAAWFGTAPGLRA